MAANNRLAGPRSFLTEDEKKSKPKVTPALLKRIGAYLVPYIFQFVLVFAAILLSAVVGLLPSIITGRIVDEALIGRNMQLLLRLLAAAAGTLFASQLIGVLEQYINSWISARIVRDMKNQMFTHLQSMPHSFFTTEKQGDIVTRMNSDVNGVSTVISGTLTSVVSNIATVVTTVVALFTMNWQLALVGILIIPLLILPTRSVGKTRWELLSKSQAKQDELNEIVNESLSVSGSLLVKLFSGEQRRFDTFKAVNNDVTEISMKEQRSGKWYRMLMGIFTQIGPLLIYFAGGYVMMQVPGSTLSVGVITATVALVNRLYRPVQSLLSIQVDFTRSMALFTRIFEYLDMKSSIVESKDAKRPSLEHCDIVYKNVRFGYSEDKPILTDVNFTVPDGQMYAIVGPSGSGKSTIVNLIPRIYDVQGGSVSVAGTDVRDFELAWLRGAVGMVTQEAYLFNGTVRENLLFAKPDATEEEMLQACKIADIKSFIDAHPEGLDTIVGNRGLKLSGGEKQRISLARVVLKNPRVLILDEATSALDSISEQAIQNALDMLMHGRTSIVIAHRLSTVLAADRILVINDGVICEQGQHDELLAMGGLYAQLYETQFRRVLEHEHGKQAAEK